MMVRSVALGVLALAVSGSMSLAATVGFSFSVLSSEAARTSAGVLNSGPNPIGGNAGNATANTPFILLTSHSASSYEINSFSFTLVSGKVIDFSVKENVYGGGFGWTQVSPGPVDTNTGGTTPDAQSSALLRYDFGAGFGAGEKFSSQLDFDPGSLTDVQLRSALQGATVGVTFSNSQVLTATFAPAVNSTTYTVSALETTLSDAVAVPTPGAAAMGAVAAPLMMLRRRR